MMNDAIEECFNIEGNSSSTTRSNTNISGKGVSMSSPVSGGKSNILMEASPISSSNISKNYDKVSNGEKSELAMAASDSQPTSPKQQLGNRPKISSTFYSKVKNSKKQQVKTPKKQQMASVQLNQVRKALDSVTESFAKSVGDINRNFEQNIKLSHTYITNLLDQQSVHTNEAIGKNNESIEQLAGDVGSIAKILPTVASNSQHIQAMQTQLNAIADLVRKQTLTTHKSLPTQTPPEPTEPYKLTFNVGDTNSTQLPQANIQDKNITDSHAISPHAGGRGTIPLYLPRQVEVKKFDGYNMMATTFLKRINKYFSLCGLIDETQKMQYFEYMLVGKAAVWFQTVESLYSSWPTLQEAFLNYFQGVDEVERKKRIWETYYLPKSNDVQEFILESINLLQTIYPNKPFTEIAEMIVHKLPKELRLQLRRTHIPLTTIDIFITSVKNILHITEMDEEDEERNRQNYLRGKTPYPSYLQGRSNNTNYHNYGTNWPPRQNTPATQSVRSNTPSQTGNDSDPLNSPVFNQPARHTNTGYRQGTPRYRDNGYSQQANSYTGGPVSTTSTPLNPHAALHISQNPNLSTIQPINQENE